VKYHDFRHIYERLRLPTDVQRLSQEMGLDEELLNVIFTQRTVRETTKKFYRVQREANHLLHEWRRGTSMLALAERHEFSPILTAMMIYQANGCGKKTFWKAVREPNSITDGRTKREIIEITEADPVYSPWGNEVQYKRGLWGEGQLQGWLDSRGLTYRTEKDLRGEYPKTPDCLLDEPIRVNGWDINWIESKASFGDKIEINKNVKKQLTPYTELFGDGLVVYWFGFVDEIENPEGIFITDASLLHMDCTVLKNGCKRPLNS
jgi:hypothetical protein